MKRTLYILLVVGMLIMTGCQLDQLKDPNNPTVDLVNNPTVAELQNLVSGIEAGMRNRLGTYYDAVALIGREYYRYSASDPRFTGDLLGKGSSTLDNNTFYTTGPYYERYRVIRNCYYLLDGVDNTTAPLTDAQKNGCQGFAKTIIAYQLLLVLNMQNENGIRVDVKDPDNLGPVVSKTEAFQYIANLLDEAANDLSNAGSEFAFDLSTGFDGFDTPPTFRQFNRALAARVAVYREDWTGALTALNGSFLDVNNNGTIELSDLQSVDLQKGPKHFFSTAGGDELNPLYLPLNNGGEVRAAHPSFVADAETGDKRADPNDDAGKIRTRAEAFSADGLSSPYDTWVYRSNDAPIPIIRAEELVLIYAEANIQLGNTTDAVNALNVVRNAAGLGNYAGGTTQSELIDEMLNQRRYALFAEGHRWIDMRRYGRLNQLPIDRPGDDVWESFPLPANENVN
jgi:hypothetical protein